MTAIVVGTIAVVAIIMLLVIALVLFERHYLPTGPIRIAIDGGGRLEVEGGGSLLETLSDQGILLPAACGGTGKCGNCRVRIAHAPPPFPTERVHLSRSDLADGWRLACQQRVRRDLEIALPAQLHTATKHTCEVRSSRSVATYIREIVLALPPGERLEFAAGSYIQVDVPSYRAIAYRDFEISPGHRHEWQQRGLVGLVARNAKPTTRAYSLANPPSRSDLLVLNVRIATPPPRRLDLPPGLGSSWLWSLRPGDRVEVAGPFGEFHIQDTQREIVFIGGGAGMAPLRSQLLDLLETKASSRAISFWYGARSRSELFYLDELDMLVREHPSFHYHLALSDPQPGDDWRGDTGFIHDVVLERYLADHPAIDEVEFYLCGPPPMIAAVRRMLDDLGVEPNQIAFDDFGS